MCEVYHLPELKLEVNIYSSIIKMHKPFLLNVCDHKTLVLKLNVSDYIT